MNSLKILTSFTMMLFAFSLQAQHSNDLKWDDDYSDQWSAMEKLEKEGKQGSRFQLAKETFELSLRDHNVVGIVKSLIVMVNSSYSVDDESLLTMIQLLEDKDIHSPVINALLDSYLAEIYVVYLEKNRYKISNRTESDLTENKEIALWTETEFIQKITTLNRQSVSVPALKSIESKRLKSMFEAKDSIDYSWLPTLYDVLMERNINFLENRRLVGLQPKIVNDTHETSLYFSEDLKPILNDYPELAGFEVVKAYQQWEAFNQSNKESKSYLAIILHRAQYFYENFASENDTAYIALLDQLITRYADNEHILKAYYQKAELHFNKKQDYIAAKKIVDTGLNNIPINAVASDKAQLSQLLKNILAKELSIQVEFTYPKSKSILFNIQHRNLTDVKFTLYEISQAEYIEYFFPKHYNDANVIEQLKDSKNIWEKSLKLKSQIDYKSHSTEYVIDKKLPFGHYVLCYTSDQEGVQISGSNLFQISNINVVEINNSQYHVLDRQTGAVVKNSEITIQERPNYTRSLPQPLVESIKATDGQFMIDRKQLGIHSYLIVKKNKDVYISPGFYTGSKGSPNYRVQQNILFYTDRAIYQPGQKIFVKALAVSSERLSSELLTNKSITLFLKDANGQEVWQNTYTTDQWGSINAIVPVPLNGLKGDWSLTSNLSGYKNLSIESYTRPNYEIHFNKDHIKMTEELVTAFGYVKTYAGFPIENAKILVNVVMKQQTRWFYYQPNPSTMPVFQTEVTTDSAGRFEVSFKPILPLQDDYRSSYYYDFNVEVSSTSGEMQEASQQMSLNENKKFLQITCAENINLNKPSEIQMKAEDGLGSPTEWKGKLRIYSLQTPKQYMINRYWTVPDQFLLKDANFQKSVDHILPRKESNWKEWKEEKLLIDQAIAIDGNKSMDLPSLLKQPGYYKVELLDETGNTMSEHYLFGYNDSKFNLMHHPFVIDINQEEYKPGDEATIRFYTHKKVKQLLLVYARPNGEEKTVSLKGNSEFKLDIKLEDLGGISFKVIAQLYNRTEEQNFSIAVPWSEKNLQIKRLDETDTLDVKKDYSFLFKVDDIYGKGVKTEWAVAIYDASLDAYRPNHWTTKDVFYKNFYTYIHSNVLNNQIGQQLNNQNNYWQQTIQIPGIHRPYLPKIGVQGNYYRNMYMSQGKPVMLESRRMNKGESADGVAMESVSTVAPPPPPAIGEVADGELENQKRSDFNENLFFIGKVTSDKEGRVSIPFTTNDKIGKWKVLVMAHDTGLAAATYEFEIVTKKDLYVESFVPKYLRQGDRVQLIYTVFNNTSKSVAGIIELAQSIMGNDSQNQQKQNFEISPKSSQSVTFDLTADDYSLESIKLLASLTGKSGMVLDQEEQIIQVLPAKETILTGDIAVLNPGESHHFDSSLEGEIDRVQIRIIDNIFIELLKSLPFLENLNPRTTDQMLRNFLYANLGQYIGENINGFDDVYQSWIHSGNLEGRLADQSLTKYQSLSETPWVRENASMQEQLEMMALYFDKNYIENSIANNFEKWNSSVNEDGGFPWIKGWPSDPYITANILKSIAKLQKLEVTTQIEESTIIKALEYIDAKNYERWIQLIKKMPETSEKVGPSFLRYFEVRSHFYETHPLDTKYQKFWSSITKGIYNQWASMDYSQQAKIGISAYQLHDHELSMQIAEAFVDNAIQSKTLGTYWRYNNRGYQSNYLAIHADIMDLLRMNSIAELDNGLLQWILVQKMSNDWHDNPAVFDLILAAMKIVPQSMTETNQVSIISKNKSYTDQLNRGETVLNISIEDLPTLEIKNQGNQPVWAGLQVVHQLHPKDELKEEDNQLNITKSVLHRENKTIYEKGDKIVVKLLIESDRDLDYVYISDPLLPGLDEGITFSGFQYQNGLSYYQTFDPDKAMFYVRHLPKGKYVLEYELGIVRSGTYTIPRSKIQSFYTPEIVGHDQWQSSVSFE